MEPDSLSLQSDAAAVYAELRPEYLAQLVGPMDDMWAAFSDLASPHALLVGEEVVGCCAVDEEGQLLRFYVRPRFQDRATALLRMTLTELEVTRIVACTLDPCCLSVAMDVAAAVEVHTLLYAPVTDPEGPGLDDLVRATLDDHQRLVDFEVGALGAPREFLEYYFQQRLERQEVLLFESGGAIRCVGELRRDAQQAGIAHVGMVVGAEERGRGLGSRMIASLVTHSRAEGLTPYCSTEVANLPARRAIERAGFRATHRLLRVGFPR